MAAFDEKADLPLPDISQLGLETNNAPRPAQSLDHLTSSTSPRQSGDSPAGHENKSNDKMLKAEKVLGLQGLTNGGNGANGKVKRSSSVPMLSKSKGKSSSQTSIVDPHKQHRDELIMDTNKSSIVSKRSVEKLYYDGQPEYFRYFVSKFKRRSPLINRGYWLRMKAIEHAVSRFMSERTAKKKVVINLGCG